MKHLLPICLTLLLALAACRDARAIQIEIDPGPVGTSAQQHNHQFTDLDGLTVTTGEMLDLEFILSDMKYFEVREEPEKAIAGGLTNLVILFADDVVHLNIPSIQAGNSFHTDKNGNRLELSYSSANSATQPPNGSFSDLTAFGPNPYIHYGTHLRVEMPEFVGTSSSTITQAVIGWQSSGGPGDEIVIGQTVVPEPGSLVLTVLSAVGLLNRRGRLRGTAPRRR